MAVSVNITPPGTCPLNAVTAARKWPMPAQVQSPTPVWAITLGASGSGPLAYIGHALTFDSRSTMPGAAGSPLPSAPTSM
jgi:hypothetical protein